MFYLYITIMRKYTLQQFNTEYSDDNACLDKLYKIRFADLICPKCDSDKEFTRVNDRRSYQCPCCGFQVYPTANTVFHKSTTPLKVWFHAIFMQTTTRNGVSAKELERTFDICYKTALRMSHQIKTLMADNSDKQLLGICEADECYIGGEMKNKHLSKRNEMKKGRGGVNMQPIFGVVLRRDGIVRARVINDVTANTLRPLLSKNVSKDSYVVTDSATAYTGLKKEFKKHAVVNHNQGEYVRGDAHTNTIEGFWSQLKRTIGGTHIQVTSRHLQKYVDEVAFRYQHRNNQDNMFNLVLARVAS